jgi:hypothetical protein
LPTLSEAVFELKSSCIELNESLHDNTEVQEVESSPKSPNTSKYIPPSKKFKLSLFSQSKGNSSTLNLSREFIIVSVYLKFPSRDWELN